jgi:GTP-binding protein YchF
VRGASKGEGLGNQFLANIRETDAVLHVVRCFEDPNVVHVEGSVDPERDIEVIETELLLADLDALQKKNERVSRLTRVGQKEYAAQAEALAKAIEAVEKGTPLRAAGLSAEEKEALRELNPITLEPVLYVANVAEGELGKETPLLQKVRKVAADKGGEVVVICGELEAQIAQLPPEEREHFLKEMGLEEPGLDVLVRAAYKLLDLETFFTAGPKRRARGRSSAGRRRPRPRGKSTVISSAGSSAPRRSPTTTTSLSVASNPQRPPGRCAAKERNTRFRTGT